MNEIKHLGQITSATKPISGPMSGVYSGSDSECLFGAAVMVVSFLFAVAIWIMTP